MIDKEDLAKRNVLDGDPFIMNTPSWRFRKPQLEPYMPSQAPGMGGMGGGRMAVRMGCGVWGWYEGAGVRQDGMGA